MEISKINVNNQEYNIVASKLVDSNGDEVVIPSSYNDLSYDVATQSASGALTIDGSKALHIVTATGNITSVTLSTPPAVGHSTHVIISASAARTVAIAHNATARVCPGAANLSLSITKNGYVELDFLNDGNKIYVRGV